MQSLGTGRRRSGQIPANRRPGPAGCGRGTTLRSLGLIPVLGWAGRGPARGGVPEASGGGRHDRCAGEVAALWGRRLRRRARVGAREGGGDLDLVCSRPDPELAAAAFNSAGRRLDRGMAGTQVGQRVRRGQVFNMEGEDVPAE
jgi:hypothetical protein